MIVYQCRQCGVHIEKKFPSQVKTYCSRQCGGIARRKTPEGVGKYKSRSVPRDHPLLTPGMRNLTVHRAVLWGKIGPGTHPCHHCSEPVTWSPGARTRKGVLQVDHLDHDTRNNDPDNLVPSCHTCNNLRKLPRVDAVLDHEPHYVRKSGHRTRTAPMDCIECGNIFWDALCRVGKRQYCSQRCSGRAMRRAQLMR